MVPPDLEKNIYERKIYKIVNTISPYIFRLIFLEKFENNLFAHVGIAA